jgi:hypothetical protein
MVFPDHLAHLENPHSRKTTSPQAAHHSWQPEEPPPNARLITPARTLSRRRRARWSAPYRGGSSSPARPAYGVGLAPLVDEAFRGHSTSGGRIKLAAMGSYQVQNPADEFEPGVQIRDASFPSRSCDARSGLVVGNGPHSSSGKWSRPQTDGEARISSNSPGSKDHLVRKRSPVRIRAWAPNSIAPFPGIVSAISLPRNAARKFIGVGRPSSAVSRSAEAPSWLSHGSGP